MVVSTVIRLGVKVTLCIRLTAVVVGVLRKLRWGSIIVVVTGIGAIVATGGRRRTCVGGLSVIFI